jgi:hypothetical protein
MNLNLKMQEEVKQQVLEFLKFNGYTKTALKLQSEKPTVPLTKTTDQA